MLGIVASSCGGASASGAAVPVIFEVLDPVRPDETLLLFGADVTSRAAAEGLRLPDEPVSHPPRTVVAQPTGSPEKLEMLQATDLSAKVLMPRSWKPGVFAVRLRSATGIGEWLFANRPQIWWQMSGFGGIAHPGGELRLFGKNFGWQSRVWIEDASGKATSLDVSIARDYDVTAKLPPDLASGEYRAWLHNGLGGQAGFGKPLTFTVAAAENWPAETFAVGDFGAKGDNTTDDTEAIRAALAAAAQNGGGVVTLPTGIFVVTSKLALPRRTVVRGAGRGVTYLKTPSKAPEFDVLFAGSGEFAVEDLSVVARSVHRLVASPDLASSYRYGWARWGPKDVGLGRVRLSNVDLQHLYFSHRRRQKEVDKDVQKGPSTVTLNGPDCVVEDSRIVSSGMPIHFGTALRTRVSRCELRNGRRGWYNLTNFEQGVFEENDVSAGDLEGSYGGVHGTAWHVMFRANRWHDAYGAEREALTFDTPYRPVWLGRVGSISKSEFRLVSHEAGQWPPSRHSYRLCVAIVAGKGLGQLLPVAKIDGSKVTLAGRFDVLPDSDSLAVISAIKSEVLVVDNAFADANVAVQLYAQSHRFVVANNRAIRTGGSYAHGFDGIDPVQKRRFSYAWFNQWIGNVFREGFVFDRGPWKHGYVGYGVHRGVESSRTTPAIGNRFVENLLQSGSRLGGTTLGRVGDDNKAPTSIPMGRDAIFEDNLVIGGAVGIQIDPGHHWSLLRGNRFREVTTTYQDRGVMTRLMEPVSSTND